MASNMKRKFEKYWENMDNQNMLLYVGIVLDPRYKMRYLDFGLRKMYAYDQSKIIDMSWKVKNAFIRMYEAYIQNEEGSSPQRTSSPREDASPSTTQSTNRHAALMAQFKQELQSEDSLESRSEVDRYLAEKCEDEGDNFDLLNWWKVNSVRYRILSKVARDVLAIPVSTVASESTFSTAGRVLDPFRSSLNPMMVEALICAQNWLRSSSTPISLRTLMDEVEEFEKQIDMGELVGELAYSAEGSNEMATES
ncbi:zinc finger BED domain-containing protein RICESLEEPER 1-like [Carya illinoinensis]|nr:zinc finger BED domain-containing protein RICESLEEPER 1-like [Carya illinoinensis]